MAIRQKPENTIEFSEKGIIIYLTKAIYDAIEKVAGSSPAFGSKGRRCLPFFVPQRESRVTSSLLSTPAYGRQVGVRR